MEICNDFLCLVPKDDEARKLSEISSSFYPVLRSEHKHSSLLWFSCGAVQKLWHSIPASWPAGTSTGKAPKGQWAAQLSCGSIHLMDVLSHKALLNLHLPSLEILKGVIHIPVTLYGSSVFLQAHIPPPQPWFILRKSWFSALENFGENMLSFHLLLQSLPWVWRRRLSKFPIWSLWQITRQTNSIRF